MKVISHRTASWLSVLWWIELNNIWSQKRKVSEENL